MGLSKKIIGFKMMVANAGTKIPDFKACISANYVEANIFSKETIVHSKEIVNANCTDYDEVTGIMTFSFPKPMHEMELPERFIDEANGIEVGKSNRELIYEK